MLTVQRPIIYQQLSGKAAATIYRRFLNLYPEGDFPTPLNLLNTEIETLRSAGLSKAKASYIKDLASKVFEGLPTLKELEGMDDETIIKSLTQVKGIGPWTAKMFLIFRLHRWDVLPSDDLGVREAVRRAYQLVDLPDQKNVEKIGQQWQPYRTIATWYLWRSLSSSEK
jgi:DNA-3-methyladenine glycosylase II